MGIWSSSWSHYHDFHEVNSTFIHSAEHSICRIAWQGVWEISYLLSQPDDFALWWILIGLSRTIVWMLIVFTLFLFLHWHVFKSKRCEHLCISLLKWHVGKVLNLRFLLYHAQDHHLFLDNVICIDDSLGKLSWLLVSVLLGTWIGLILAEILVLQATQEYFTLLCHIWQQSWDIWLLFWNIPISNVQ